MCALDSDRPSLCCRDPFITLTCLFSLSSHTNEGLIHFLSKETDLLQVCGQYSTIYAQKRDGFIMFQTNKEQEELPETHWKWG